MTEKDIVKCTSTVHTVGCNRIPYYLVIHYTAGVTSKAGSARNTANYFRKSTRNASADFIVDDAEMVQYNPDPTRFYCYAVGGAKYTKMSTIEGGKFYGKAKNANCISIEMCSNKVNTKTLNASDTDWYFTDATIRNAANLAKYLMNLYNIPIDRVIMHHHVNGKVCPNPWCVNNERLNEWRKFKNTLIEEDLPVAEQPIELPIYVTKTDVVNEYVKIGQQHSINFTGVNIPLTGFLDAETKKQAIRVLQQAMNLDYKKTLPLNGKMDAATTAAMKGHYVKNGETQFMVSALIILLLLHGYVVPLSANPAVFDATLEAVVKTYQLLNGLVVTGVADVSTFKRLVQ